MFIFNPQILIMFFKFDSTNYRYASIIFKMVRWWYPPNFSSILVWDHRKWLFVHLLSTFWSFCARLLGFITLTYKRFSSKINHFARLYTVALGRCRVLKGGGMDVSTWESLLKLYARSCSQWVSWCQKLFFPVYTHNLAALVIILLAIRVSLLLNNASSYLVFENVERLRRRG